MASSTFTGDQSISISVKSVLGPMAHYLAEPARLLRGYERVNLRPDLMAGLTVAVILLPQAIAFALIAELPPQMGLYAAVIGGLAGALWGSSNQIHNGPTNAISLLVLSTLSSTAVPGTPEYIMAAAVLALMAGLFQLFLGLARLGVLVNFVSHSVIVGFASGAGVLILIKQIAPLLGLNVSGHNTLETALGIVTHVPESHLLTAAIGIGTVIFLVIMRRINPNLPAALMAMVIASLLVFLLDMGRQGVAVIGSLPSGFPPLTDLQNLDLELIRSLLTGAIAVGAIGLVETTAISKSVAAQTRQRLDSNQEFVGQGMANALSGLFSGYPVAGSFSRTAVNFRAGAKTRMAAIMASLFVLVSMQVLGPFASYLPRSALAAVLIVTAYRMIDQAEIRRILRGSTGDAVIMVVTFLGTLFLEIETAVLIGILLSFMRYVMRSSTPRVHAVTPDETFKHFGYDPERDHCPQLGVVEILGTLYFGAVNYVEDFILDHAAQHPEQRYLLLRMRNVNNCDFSGIHMLESVVRTYRERGGDVFLVRVSYRVRQHMEKTNFDEHLGLDNFLDEDAAISNLFYRVLDPAVCVYECPVRVFKECQNLPKRLDLVGLLPGQLDLPEGVEFIAPSDLWAKLHDDPEKDAPVVVDVREPREYRRGHIAEARSVPLPLVSTIQETLSKDRPIVLACRTGRRSRRAACALAAEGHTNITILDGGMLAWQSSGLLEAIHTFA